MKQAVIYTSLTGGYDNLPQYDVIDPDFDYVCFTNDYPAGTKVGQWEIRPIPIESKDKILLSRYAKLMPHAVFPDYEYSVWLDANLVITDKSIYSNFHSRIDEHGEWYGIKHPQFDCIYEDARKCLKSAKVNYKELAPQIRFLRSENYPENIGLFENNIIIRKHNSNIIKKIDIYWWELYLKFSHRDQMSLWYVFWKLNFVPCLIFSPKENSHNLAGIRFIKHNPSPIYHRIYRKLKCYYNRVRLYFCSDL